MTSASKNTVKREKEEKSFLAVTISDVHMGMVREIKEKMGYPSLNAVIRQAVIEMHNRLPAKK